MTVTTSKGKTFDVNWMWAPIGEYGDLMLEYEDNRKFSEIISDFEGCNVFDRKSTTEGDAVYEGYTEIRSIARLGISKVQITFRKP